jgi:hypothetical protein
MINLIFKFLLPSVARAQVVNPANTDLNQTPFQSLFENQGGTVSLVNSVLNRLPYFLGGLALAAIIYSGVMYVLAMGDPGKTETAKKNLAWTFMGILALASTYIIFNIVIYLTSR